MAAWLRLFAAVLTVMPWAAIAQGAMENAPAPALGAVSETASRSLAVVQHIDIFLKQPDAAGLSDLIGATALDAGPQAVAPLAVLSYIRQPRRLRELQAQASLPEPFRAKLGALAQAAEALSEKARLEADMGRPELSRLLQEADEKIGPFITSGRIDIAGENLEKMFAGTRGGAVMAIEGKGLGPLPSRGSPSLADQKKALARAEAREAGVPLPLAALRRAVPATVESAPSQLAAAAAMIKDHSRLFESGHGEAAVHAVNFLADYIEANRYSPEVKTLVFEDVRLRYALEQIAQRRPSLPREPVYALGAAFPFAKSNRAALERGLAAAAEYIDSEPSIPEHWPALWGDDGFAGSLAGAAGNGESLGKTRLKAALELVRRRMKDGPDAVPEARADKAARFISDFLRDSAAKKDSRASALLNEIVPTRDVARARAARRHMITGAKRAATGLSAAVAAYAALGIADTAAAAFLIFALACLAALGGAYGLWGLGMLLINLNSRGDDSPLALPYYLSSKAQLREWGARYLKEYRLRNESASELRELLADYRREVRQAVESDNRSLKLLSAMHGVDLTGMVTLSPRGPFTIGMADLLRRPEPVRGRAEALLRKKLVIDAERLKRIGDASAFDDLVADALLLRFVLPHSGPKDLKQSLAAELLSLLKSANVESAESVVRDIAVHLEVRLGGEGA